MSSSLGLVADNQEIIIVVLTVLVLILCAGNIYLYKGISKLKKDADVFFAGQDAAQLEDVIKNSLEKTRELESAIVALKDADQRILHTLSYAVQKMGMIRFNPFGEVGGNQSFALALLDNYNTGVIILSLYSRDGVRIYAKPVKEGKSEYQLSKEEEESLQIAMKR